MGLYSVGYNLFRLRFANTKKIKCFFVSFATIQLVVILSLRHISTGVDVAGYVYNFKYLFPSYSFNQLMAHRWEIGFKLLNKIIYFFTSNEHIFLSLIAIFSIVPVGIFIYKYSKMPFLSFALYISFNYYSFTFSGLRQSIAYGIILISYNFIINKKPFKFVISVLFAALFHKSALIFLPAYFLADLKINKLSISVILLCDVIIFIFRKQIFQFIVDMFYNNHEVVESSSFRWMLLCIFILSYGLFFYKQVIALSKNNNALYVFLIMGVSLMIFSSVGTNVMRVADYYYMFVILFIPEVISVIKDTRLILIGGYILIILIFILYVWFLQSDGYNIVPYRLFISI